MNPKETRVVRPLKVDRYRFISESKINHKSNQKLNPAHSDILEKTSRQICISLKKGDLYYQSEDINAKKLIWVGNQTRGPWPKVKIR